MHSIRRLLLTLAAALGVASPASAQHYTFRDPVTAIDYSIPVASWTALDAPHTGLIVHDAVQGVLTNYTGESSSASVPFTDPVPWIPFRSIPSSGSFVATTVPMEYPAQLRWAQPSASDVTHYADELEAWLKLLAEEWHPMNALGSPVPVVAYHHRGLFDTGCNTPAGTPDGWALDPRIVDPVFGTVPIGFETNPFAFPIDADPASCTYSLVLDCGDSITFHDTTDVTLAPAIYAPGCTGTFAPTERMVDVGRQLLYWDSLPHAFLDASNYRMVGTYRVWDPMITIGGTTPAGQEVWDIFVSCDACYDEDRDCSLLDEVWVPKFEYDPRLSSSWDPECVVPGDFWESEGHWDKWQKTLSPGKVVRIGDRCYRYQGRRILPAGSDPLESPFVKVMLRISFFRAIGWTLCDNQWPGWVQGSPGVHPSVDRYLNCGLCAPMQNPHVYVECVNGALDYSKRYVVSQRTLQLAGLIGSGIPTTIEDPAGSPPGRKYVLVTDAVVTTSCENRIPFSWPSSLDDVYVYWGDELITFLCSQVDATGSACP